VRLAANLSMCCILRRLREPIFVEDRELIHRGFRVRRARLRSAFSFAIQPQSRQAAPQHPRGCLSKVHVLASAASTRSLKKVKASHTRAIAWHTRPIFGPFSQAVEPPLLPH